MLDGSVIATGLDTRWLGRALEVKAETGSTNDDCVALARADAPAGTVVIADWQRAGRGRRGRHWSAPPGSAVLLSTVLRPPLPAAAIGRLGMAGALAVVDAVALSSGVTAAVKYPNDVLVAGRKLAGVLPEAHLSGGRIEWAVLGIGINVRRDALPPEAATPATSLEDHAVPPERNLLIRVLLERLEARLDQAEQEPEALACDWRARDTVLGRRVSVNLGHMRLQGEAVDVDAEGRLLLRKADGAERWLTPGEVSFRL